VERDQLPTLIKRRIRDGKESDRGEVQRARAVASKTRCRWFTGTRLMLPNPKHKSGVASLIALRMKQAPFSKLPLARVPFGSSPS